MGGKAMTQIDRIEAKIDKIVDKQAEQGEILSAHRVLHEQNSKSLDEHIKRTNLLEHRMTAFEKETGKKFATALLHVKVLKVLAATLAGASAVFGIVSAIVKLFFKAGI